MNELFLYDRDEGLFRKILDKSSTLQGRYHVSPNYGHDLNTNNLEAFIQDPKFGLTMSDQKYPISVCLTPRSRFVKMPNGQRNEEFTFTLFFLTRTNVSGTGQIQQPYSGTGTSTHHVWYTWQDMKQCAEDFIEALKTIILQKTFSPTTGAPEVPLKLYCHVSDETAIYNRHTKFQIDELTGVSVTFNIYLFSAKCTMNDYQGVNLINEVTIPEATIHQLHQ